MNKIQQKSGKFRVFVSYNKNDLFILKLFQLGEQQIK